MSAVLQGMFSVSVDQVRPVTRSCTQPPLTAAKSNAAAPARASRPKRPSWPGWLARAVQEMAAPALSVQAVWPVSFRPVAVPSTMGWPTSTRTAAGAETPLAELAVKLKLSSPQYPLPGV